MTPAERLRKHQRALEKTQRELDRERIKLENQEKKLVADIKKSAKNGQIGACKIQAKDLVRTRRYITKFYQMRTQLQAISLRIQTVRSNEQMMQSMKGATSLLGSMNRQMNLPALQRIAMEFERENDIMDQRQEMMDDAIDESTGMEDEEEGEEVVNQILDEIGVDLNQQVSPQHVYNSSKKLTIYSLAKLRLAFRRTLWRRDGWRKPLAVVGEVVQTTIFRPVWTVFENKRSMKTLTVHCSMHKERWSLGWIECYQQIHFEFSNQLVYRTCINVPISVYEVIEDLQTNFIFHAPQTPNKRFEPLTTNLS